MKHDEIKATIIPMLRTLAPAIADEQQIDALAESLTKQFAVTDQTSDGYHTFDELYKFRMLYNALLFNAWGIEGENDVHKSWYHSDGELAFGGGWFIVVAELPTGQVSQHYEEKYWDLFEIDERELPNEFDGHTPADVLERLAALASGEGEKGLQEGRVRL